MENLMKKFMLSNLKDLLFKGGEEKVYRLKKTLYGLKQAPRAWYNEIDTFFLKNNFQKSKSEATLYVKKEHGNIIIICLYVVDLLFMENDVKMMQNFKQDMMQAYEMSDLGLLNYFLRIEVYQVKEGIFISQKKYAKSILQKFKMMDCRSVAIPLAANEKFRKYDGEKKLIAHFLGVWLEVCYILLQQGQILCLLLVYYPDSRKNQAKCILELQSVFYATCKEQWIMG